jgi:hydrogenase maturation protein HypF
MGFSHTEMVTLQTMLARGINAPICSSAGRLFDAVGALLGLGRRNSFEGQTPMAVEIAALRGATTKHELPFAIRPAASGAIWEIDWQPAVEALLATSCVSPTEQAAAFHRGLAKAMAEVGRRAGVPATVLAGGCFQNAFLHDLASRELGEQGFDVLTARDLPPNDGAISAGQALGALWNLTTVELPGQAGQS